MIRLLLITLCISASLTCHYSCNTCVSDSYITCLSCNTNTLNVLFESNNSSAITYSTPTMAGICTNSPPVVNLVGIAALLGGSFALLLTANKECFMYLNTLQNLAFLSFLQIGYMDPLKYIMGGLQYSLTFSAASAQIKVGDQYLLAKFGYQFQTFLTSSDLVQNGVLLLPFLSILLLSAFIVLTIKMMRDQCMDQKQRNKLTDQKMVKFIKFSKYLFYFTISESIMIIFINQFYNTQTFQAESLAIGFYITVLVLFSLYVFYFPLQYFQSQVIAFTNIVKKIAYAGIASLFYNNLLLLPLVMLGFVIFQSIYTWRCIENKTKRILILNLCEGLILVMYIIMALIEFKINSYSSSFASQIILTIMFAGFFLIPFVDTGIYIKQYFHKKTQVHNLVPMNTTIDEISKANKTTNLITQLDLPAQMKRNQIQEQIKAVRNVDTIEDLENIQEREKQEIYGFQQESPQKLSKTEKNQSEIKPTEDNSTKNENDKERMIALMNATQKSSSKLRNLKRDKGKQLRTIYGLK